MDRSDLSALGMAIGDPLAHSAVNAVMPTTASATSLTHEAGWISSRYSISPST